MRFLYPLFLIGAVAAALPIVLHLLRREAAPEVPFTAVRLLQRSPPEQTRRRTLRDLLLLVARVAALLLLAAAFARPYFRGGTADAGLLIVAIDRSYSMSAPGAFERAVALARETVDGARGERIAVIAFDDRADVVAAPGGPQEARAALGDLRPMAGGTRYAPVFVRAAELSAQEAARLVVVGDLQRAGWEESEPVAAPPGMRLELRDSGAVTANLAVTGLRREGDAVVAEVSNAAAQPASSAARLMLDGRQISETPFSVPASASIDVRIPYRAPATGALSVQIDDRAGYAADNARYLALDTDASPRVLVVSGDDDRSGFFLTRAVQAGAGDSIEVRNRQASAVGALRPDEIGANGAVVLLSTRGLDRNARERLPAFVRAGGGLVIAASPDVDPGTIAAIMGWKDFAASEQAGQPVVLAATDLRHPIFRTFGALSANLGQVRFARTWRVRGEGWDVAARFTDGLPAVLERQEGKGRVVLFASDVDRRWNDFPLHPAFVPFALEMVRHVSSAANSRRSYLVAEAPPGARAEPGVYTIEPGARRVAVNTDPRESATIRMTPEAFTAMVRSVEPAAAATVERRAQQVEARQNLWRYGLLLMMVALVSESIVGRVR